MHKNVNFASQLDYLYILSAIEILSLIFRVFIVELYLFMLIAILFRFGCCN